MFSKSLVQFSVDGWGCVPFLLFDLRPSYGGGQTVKIMATSFQRSCTCTAALIALDPAAGHCQPMPPLETCGHSWASLSQSLMGSLLLSPLSWCAQVLFVPSKSLFPQPCVSSGGSMVGLMATISKKADATPRSAAPKPLPLQQATAEPYLCGRHSNTKRQPCLSLCGSPGMHNILIEPSEHFWRVWGLILNTISPLLPSC